MSKNAVESRLSIRKNQEESLTEEESWVGLANAIIIQAADDYRVAAQRLKRFPANEKAWKEVRELEDFFRSDWFKLLSSVNGPDILEQLRKEIRK